MNSLCLKCLYNYISSLLHPRMEKASFRDIGLFHLFHLKRFIKKVRLNYFSSLWTWGIPGKKKGEGKFGA